MTGIAFAELCRLSGLPEPIAEHAFAKAALGRRWRFDWAWVDERVALEVQGGLFTGGRHARGPALLREHEKLNAAAALGWRVVFCVPKDVQAGAVIDAVGKALRWTREDGA